LQLLSPVLRIRKDVVFARFDDFSGGAAKAAQSLQEIVVSNPQALVCEAINEEIDAGVQVRDH